MSVEGADLDATFTPGLLAAGSHRGTTCVSHDGNGTPDAVPVALNAEDAGTIFRNGFE